VTVYLLNVSKAILQKNALTVLGKNVVAGMQLIINCFPIGNYLAIIPINVICLCPLDGVIDTIGKKCGLLIINEIGNHGKIRYNKLMSELKGIRIILFIVAVV